MRYLDFDVDENLKEKTRHGDETFPMAVYLQQFDLNKRGYVIPHWHDELQISYVSEGIVKFIVNEKEFVVSEGESLFMRPGCLHSAKPLVSEKSEYICINVHPLLISGIPNGLVRTQYVDSFLNSANIEAIHMSNLLPWHRNITGIIQRLFDFAKNGEFGYELGMQICISEIWLEIIRNTKMTLADERRTPPIEQQRLKALVTYIHDHYAERLNLDNIALAANISVGECCRLFKRNMRTSPIKYLINFRIAQSISLLVESDKSIAEIAQLSGFGSSSYYAECFKKLVRCTPIEYRKSHASNILAPQLSIL